MSVLACLRRSRRPSSPPESSSSDSLASSAARRLRRGLSSALLCVPLLVGLVPQAGAQTVVPNDWPLKPSGLSAGDQFRLMFITSTTRNATSTDIGDYNSFVQGRAAAGHTSIRSYSAQFRVVGSTAAVDARDNAMTTGTGVPIYWLGGAKVADDYADFHDGTWANPAGRDESGGTVSSTTRYTTGSNHDGTEAIVGGVLSLAFGGVAGVRFGEVQGLGNSGTTTIDATDSHSFLALSPVFEVGQSNRDDDTPSPLDAGRLATLDSSVSAGIALSFPGWDGLGIKGGDHRVLEGGSADHTVVLQTRPSGDVTVTIAGFSGSDVTVDVDSGTAGNQNTLTFTRLNWNIPRIVTIRAAEDTDTADDSVTLTHSASGGGYSSVASQSLDVTVYDNDMARTPYQGYFVQSTFVASETDGYMTVGFTLTRPLTEGTWLRFRYDDLSATSGLDYHPVESVWVPAGESRVSLRIKLVNDKGDEENELFRIYFESDSLKNWDPAQSVQLTDGIIQNPWKTPWSFENSDGTFTCFSSRNENDPAGHRRVPATEVSDPNGGRPGIIHDHGVQVFPLPAGVEVRWDKPSYEVGDTAVVTFRTLNAERSCADVAFSLSIASQTAEQVSSDYPHFTKASADHPVGPDFRSLVTPVLRRGATEVSVPVPLQAEGRVGFRLLWSHNQAALNIPPVFLGDSDTPLADVTDGSRYWSSRIWRDVARRTGDSPPVVPPSGQRPAVTISADRTSVAEGGDVIFTVTADPTPATDLEVIVLAEEEMGTGDDRVAGSHFGRVTIRAGTASATWTHTTMSDDDDLADGTVEGRIVSGDGYTAGDPSSVTVTLLDDDGVVPQSVPDSVVGDPVTPGVDAALVAEVTALADGHSNPAAAARLRRIVKGMTGEDGGYTAQECRETATRHGVLSTWKPWCDEIARREAHTLPVPQQQQVVTLPAVTVSAGADVTEGGDAVFTLTASPAPASPLAVSVTVAATGEFGIGGGKRPVTIPTTGSATLTLATANDAADEPDGSVSVTVAAGDGYTVGSPASGSVSIADDDLPPPVVSIAAKAASVTEGGAAAFTLTADRAPDADLTVTLSVAETGGGDHVAAADEGPATAVIAKGATEAVFSVATVDDDANEPDGSVTVTLKDGGGYTVPSPPGNAAAVTVSDNDAAAALPSLSVADATVTEGGRVSLMWFTVRLSEPSAKVVTVRADTRPSTPMSARPGQDYRPLHRLVHFRPNATEQRVAVFIYNDSHDEEPETFEVVLSDARGAAIADGVAVGTITNDDPLPAAWLARFGRAVAEQALDGIAARMTADRTPGLRGTIAGQALDFGGNAAGGPDLSQFPGSLSGAGPGLLFGSGVEAQSRGMTMQEVLRGSSFSLTGEADGSGGTLSFWGGSPGSGGLVSGSRFAGSDASVRLDGETGAALLGTDYARGRWLVGFALSQVRAEGGYAGEGGSDCSGLPASVPASACAVAARAGDGEVEASLTATIPYVALAVSERLRLWGAAGQGAGDVTVKTGSGGSYRADTAWSMAAAGLRGDLLAPAAPGSLSGAGSGSGSGAGSGTGPALALTSDALWVRTSSEKTVDLAASESDVSRLRVGLEGSWGVALSGGGSVTPKLELGARHDGGDAETGFGVELGGGLAWRDPKLGLTLDLSGRTLVAHDDGGLEDRGVSARLSYDPEPSSGRGLSLSLGQDWGGRSAGGLDALFQPEPLEDREGNIEATSRWAMEAAWGLPALGGRFTGSPYMGLGLATGARDYSLGWRLTPEAATAPGLSFGLRATRRESGSAAPEHILGIEATARW